VIRVGSTQDDASSARESLGGGKGADKGLEVLTLLLGEDNGWGMRGWHGNSPGLQTGLVFLLSAIRTLAHPGYDKLPGDLRNAVLRHRPVVGRPRARAQRRIASHRAAAAFCRAHIS